MTEDERRRAYRAADPEMYRGETDADPLDFDPHDIVRMKMQAQIFAQQERISALEGALGVVVQAWEAWGHCEGEDCEDGQEDSEGPCPHVMAMKAACESAAKLVKGEGERL